MRLARKLAIALMLAVVTVFTVRALIRVRREIARDEADAREHQLIVARSLRPSVVEIWRAEGPTRARAVVRAADAAIRRRGIRWVALDGAAPVEDRPVVQVAALAPLRSGGETSVRYAANDEPRLATYVSLSPDGSIPGALEVTESLLPRQQALRSTLVYVLGTSALAALAAMAMVSWLGIVMVGRPIRRLVEQARRIGLGEFSTRLKVTQRDEIGALAHEMNRMCDHLQEAQRQVEQETNARLAALEQLRHADRLSTVGKLASGIAHELGTPLNVVSGRAQMIAREEVKGAASLESARIIAEQADRMTHIIRQLLDFARRRVPQKTPCDLAEICRKTLAWLRPLGQKHQVNLEFVAEELPPAESVLADAGQLHQALTNLVVNAVQAMPSGGTVTITARVVDVAGDARPGPHVAVEVRDEGTGIPADQLPHLFEPFFSTKGVGEGTGLGLSVTYGIVRDHGGWIDIQSQLGQGSRFTVYVPLAEVKP